MRQRNGEKGSALLIVFVFAAMAAIMLYMEMPVVVFEARRQKEQLLIDRGNEYKHAVKLFVRKTGMYPSSLDQLEDTNRMRFLRHRFKDPFTGKDDWRLLHAGPGGIIIDSKVNPINANGTNGQNGQNGQNGTAGSSFGSNSGFGSNTASGANSGFGSSSNSASSGFGSSSTSASSGFGSSASSPSSSFGSSSSGPEVVVPSAISQRAPAISASGGGTNGPPASGSEADPNAFAALTQPGQSGQISGNAQNGGGVPGGAASDQAGAGAQPGQTANSDSSNPMDAVRNLLSNPNSPAPAGTPGTTAGSTPGASGNQSTMGVIAGGGGGGIAGVASIAHGHTIKTVEDQTDYSLWEFYYDPRKDNAAPGIAGAVPGNSGVPGQPSTGQNLSNGNPAAGQGPIFPSSTTPQPTSAPPPPPPPPQQ